MFYPLLINFENKKIVFVGGGKVAKRKILSMKDVLKNPEICVVSPEIEDDLKSEVEYIKDVYKKDYIKDAFFVIAATENGEVNEAVKRDCEELEILFCSVEGKDESNVIFPSIVGSDGLLIAVSTDGKFPALSKKIRRELEDKYAKYDEKFIDLLCDLRKFVLENRRDEKAEIFEEALNLDYDELKDYYKKLKLEKK